MPSPRPPARRRRPGVLARRGVGMEGAVATRRSGRDASAVPHRKRVRRVDEPGHAHALTWSCWRRRKFLNADRSRRWVPDAIDRAREKHPFAVWAYVLMPEHLHLVVCPTDREYDTAAFCASVKTSVARRAVPWVRNNAPDFLPKMPDEQPNGKRSYRFWQRGGGYDRNLTHAGTALA